MAITTQSIMSNQTRMEAARSSYDTAWGEIAAMVYPELADMPFSGGMSASAFMRDRFDNAWSHNAYGVQALEDGVSIFEGFVMPRGQRWQGFELADEALNRKVANRQWLEQLAVRLFARRNDPHSGFAGAINACGTSLFAFCAQSLWVDHRYDAWGRRVGLSYQPEFIGDVWIERDAEGSVMRVHRRIVLTAEQARLKWGDSVSRKVKEHLAKSGADAGRQFTFLHVIERNAMVEPGRMDWRGKPWAAAYYCEEGKEVFLQGGYNSLRRIVSSFSRAAGRTWGRSPTMKVLPLLRVDTVMTEDRVAGAEMRLKPPLLTADDELDDAVLEIKPFGITAGGLDDRGNPMVREFLTAADATDARELTAEARMLIDRAFYRDLLQMNREMKTHVSAARTQEEIAEKGLLLAPLARQEQEWLSPMTQAELALMQEAGDMDDMPEEIREYLAEAGPFGMKYDNELTRMMEAGKSAAFLNLAGMVAPLAQFDPTVVEAFKREYPMEKVIPELGRIAGVPASMMASDDEKAAYDEAKAAQAQTEQLLAAVPALAGAAKDAASAGGMGL